MLSHSVAVMSQSSYPCNCLNVVDDVFIALLLFPRCLCYVLPFLPIYCYYFLSDVVSLFHIAAGSGLSTVSSSSTISLNTWHTVHAQRSGNSVDLAVDGVTTHYDGSGMVGLTASDTAYVGGLPLTVQPSEDIGTTLGFQGCIYNLQVSCLTEGSHRK